MRPLPRVLAYADNRIAALEDLGVRAAAVAAVGPAVALVARRPAATADELAALAQRFAALAAPPMASVFVTGRTDVALATHATGVVLRCDDLDPADARRVATGQLSFVVFRSVHSMAEAETAVAAGIDGLIVGTIWDSTSHDDRAGSGTALLHAAVSLGTPVFAIGGVTLERAAMACDAGAYGVAAISAIWDAPQPYRAAAALASAWSTH